MTDLLLVEGGPGGEKRAIGSDTTVGREGCDLVLPDVEVSRRHAVIRRLPSGYAVEDLGSTNGTFVNDRRISESSELSDGDKLRFGETVFMVRLPAEETRCGAATPAPDRTHVASAGAAAESPPPEPAAAPEPAPEPAAAPSAQQGQPKRGDVPAPDEVPPSAIRRALPAGAALQAESFDPTPAGRRGPSAARRIEATIVCYAVVLATAAGIVLYFVQR